jgi:hypothetical protein
VFESRQEEDDGVLVFIAFIGSWSRDNRASTAMQLLRMDRPSKIRSDLCFHRYWCPKGTSQLTRGSEQSRDRQERVLITYDALFSTICRGSAPGITCRAEKMG